MRSPDRPRRARRFAAAVAVVGSVLSIAAVAHNAGLAPGATVSRTAVRIPEPQGDLVVVFDFGEVDRFVVEASARAAARTGGGSTVSRSGSLGLRELRRGNTVVHAPPPGYLIPTVYITAPENPLGRIFGTDVAAALGPGKVVMNELTAELTGARVGDVIVLQSAGGVAVPLDVAAIAPYDRIGWAELVFTYDVAARLGATEDTRVVLHDVDRATIDAALAAEGLIGRADTRVVRSWDPPDPDDILSTVRTKVALGEPWYRFEADGSISMHPDWKAANLTDGRVLLNDTIPIRARCHLRVLDDLRAALADVAAAGLGGAIDVGNANTYGGCYAGARFSRLSGQIGFLSRHSYGMALDTNTTTNCFGCTPQMHCDVVRIFRRHGFAWGGNFRRPDGMHFEWVGERRDTWSYPSTYCPNLAAGPVESGRATSVGAGVLTVGGEALHAETASGHEASH